MSYPDEGSPAAGILMALTELIDIEPTFLSFAKTFRGGGSLLAFVPIIPDGVRNADFYFPKDDVIAELKTLETDTLEPESFIRRVMAAFKWLGYSQVDFADWAMRKIDLPDDVSKRVYAASTRSIVACVRSAQKQIAKSRELLGRPNALGLVLIANSASVGFTPPQLMNAISKGFAQRPEKGSEAAVYFTPNVYHDFGDGVQFELWVPVANDGGNSLQQFMDDMGRAWFDYGETSGRPSSVRREASDMSALLTAKVVRDWD